MMVFGQGYMIEVAAMRKIIYVLCSFILVVSMTSCAAKKQETLHMGLNAVIVDIDSENKMLTVKDAGNADIFGSSSLIDCSDAYIIYCDYDTGDVKDIEFEDLKEDDEIIISIYESQLELIENNDTAKVDQVQLGTQRLG